VFVGNPSSRVRDELWLKAVKAAKETGGVLQMWSERNPQGYSCRQYGKHERTIVDFEGLVLVTMGPSQSGLTGFDTEKD